MCVCMYVCMHVCMYVAATSRRRLYRTGLAERVAYMCKNNHHAFNIIRQNTFLMHTHTHTGTHIEIFLCTCTQKLYAPGKNNHHACNIIRQSKFLTQVLASLEEDASSESHQRVLSDLEEMKKILTKRENVWVQVCMYCIVCMYVCVCVCVYVWLCDLEEMK